MTEKKEIASKELKKEFIGEAEKELEKVGGGISNPVAGLTEEEARKRAAELDKARDEGSMQTMSGEQFMRWWRASNNIPEPDEELSEEAAALVSGGDEIVLPTPGPHHDPHYSLPVIDLQIKCPIEGCGVCLSSIKKLEDHLLQAHGVNSSLCGGLIHEDLPNP